MRKSAPFAIDQRLSKFDLVELNHILIPYEGFYSVIDISEIRYVTRKDNHKCMLHLVNNKKILLDGHMHKLCKELKQSDQFIQIDNIALINKAYIKRFKTGFYHYVILDDDSEFRITAIPNFLEVI